MISEAQLSRVEPESTVAVRGTGKKNLVFMKTKVGFQRGTQCHMYGEVRQLREENCVSGFGVLFQGVGRDWGPKQAALDEVEKQRLDCTVPGFFPRREAFRDGFVLTRHL